MRPEAPSALGRLVIVGQVEVRPCLAEDLPQLEWFGLFRAHREIFADAFARHLRGENLMLVADLRGFPIGQAWLDLAKRRSEGVGYIWAVRVFPILRGLGIGSRLMREAEQLLCAHGYAMGEVGVEIDNPEARAWYERLGYRMTSQLREEYSYTTPDGVYAQHSVDQWILRKRIELPQAGSGG